MRKDVIWWIAFVIIIIALGGWWYSINPATPPSLFDDTANAVSPTPTTASSPTPTKAATAKKPTPTGTQTYKSLVTQTSPHQCDYDQVTSTGHMSGVIYIADGKMRTELRAVTDYTAQTGTLTVYDGRYLYTWREGMTAGTKTLPSSVSELPLIIPADLSSKTVLGTGGNSVSWNCHPWIKDAKLMVPPSYVTFKAQ